jgi:phage-related protein
MTTTALPLPTKIVLDSDKSVSFRAISSQFGDGYQQIAPNGINNRVASWTIEWAPLTQTERDTVESVLDSVGSWGILTWTPCMETVQLKFRMSNEGYSRKSLSKVGLYSISCKLVQVFDI